MMKKIDVTAVRGRLLFARRTRPLTSRPKTALAGSNSHIRK